jgi:phospholipase C
LPAYTFIEPQYDGFNHFANGNSQHPLGAVSVGERLIRDTYNALFQNDAASNTLLLVTWDEHGGFFDHVTPPPATPPGDDQRLNHQRAAHPCDCKFDQLGPRVPALLVSPWLPTGLGSQVFAGQVFEHASILAFLREVFQLGEPLTQRDAKASSWHGALLKSPRTLPALSARLPAAPGATTPLAELQNISHSLLGTLHIATAVDWDLAAKTGQPPLLAGSFKPMLSKLHQSLSAATPTLTVPAQQKLIANYLSAVDKRERTTQKKLQRKSKG